MAGKVLPESSMFMRELIGNAEHEGKKYDAYRIWGSSTPLIFSHETKQYFKLEWSEIIQLAIDAGIDTPISEEKSS